MVHPGFSVESVLALIPLKRLSEHEEIVSDVCFFSSNAEKAW